MGAPELAMHLTRGDEPGVTCNAHRPEPPHA